MIGKIKELDSKYPKNNDPVVFKKILKQKYYTNVLLFGNQVVLCSNCKNYSDDSGDEEDYCIQENGSFIFSFGDYGDECDDGDDGGDGDGDGDDGGDGGDDGGD